MGRRACLAAGALAVIVGCGGPIPIAPRWHGSPETIDLVLADVEAILGQPLEVRERSYGALRLWVHHSGGPGEVRGESLVQQYGCRRIAWSTPEPHAIAHEIGHAVGGLGHLDEIGNLMHPDALGDALEDWQRREIDEGARALRACTVGW